MTDWTLKTKWNPLEMNVEEFRKLKDQKMWENTAGQENQVLMMSWCLMSSDVIWHIRDKLWPMPKHGSIILYVHGNQKAR